MLGACGSGGGEDDAEMNMSALTGKWWYYNAWLGSQYKYDMNKQDLLEVIRFEKGGALKVMEYGGRREQVVGTWTSGDNEITLNYSDGRRIEWNVRRSGADYIQAVAEGWERRYTSEPDYLGDLTADAFLAGEWKENRYNTYIGADIRGNKDVKEAALISSDGNAIPLENHGYFWSERSPENGDYIDFDGTKREVRFYLRIGKNTYLKLQDTIYAQNIPPCTLAESGLLAVTDLSTGALKVSWNAYPDQDICYRVEIFPKEMDLSKPYFVSMIQPAGSTEMAITPTSATDNGVNNQVGKMIKGETYQVRLTAMLFEPGVDRINDHYSSANLQAVSYFTRPFIWEAGE